ncbi:MAG: HAD family phosphatase [Erysipelotrichaceae bacterium]|nr:HAD family phosphatase [Erysipelotrichaceae bacterium]
MKRAVLFDMDGILFDSEPWYIRETRNWMKNLGFQGTEQDVSVIIGMRTADTYHVLSGLLENRYSIDELRNANETWFREHPVDAKQLMFEGVDTVLHQLKEEGFLTACCSSSRRRSVIPALEKMGILELFDVILCGDEQFAPKPAPDIYLKAAEMLGVSPSQCIVYEDSARGIASGKNAGMTVIARKDDRFRQDQSRADALVSDIYEMHALAAEGGNICRK